MYQQSKCQNRGHFSCHSNVVRGGKHIKQRGRMVKLHIKRGDESQFLVETTVEIPVSELIVQLIRFYNGRLKVDRLCQGETPEGNLGGRT